MARPFHASRLRGVPRGHSTASTSLALVPAVAAVLPALPTSTDFPPLSEGLLCVRTILAVAVHCALSLSFFRGGPAAPGAGLFALVAASAPLLLPAPATAPR